MNFLTLKSVDEAARLFAAFAPLEAERVPVGEARGRILAEDIVSPEEVPAFDRATMDGYAVRARDTHGSSEGLPAYLKLLGRVPMGGAFDRSVGIEEAAEIGTGGELPVGTDAVVMIEYTRKVAGATGESTMIEVTRPVAAGDNLIRRGEDLPRGAPLLACGAQLRVQDLGVLAAVGVREVAVRMRPRVAILSTGNELVPTNSVPGHGQVRDVNSLCLASQIEAAGAIATIAGIARDDEAELASHCRALIESHDALFLSGGSSVGTRDLTSAVFAAIGAEVVLHGISIAPGKPTILARWRGKPIIGMPGYPVSSMVIFWIFGAILLAALEGRPVPADPLDLSFPRRARARLTRNVASKPGREDYVRVRLSNGGAEPILLGTATLSTLLRADGLARIPRELDGIIAGTDVDVLLF